MTTESVRRTSELLATIIRNAEDTTHVTVGTFVSVLGDRAFGIAILLFALPNAIPLPSVPGVSTITGVPIMLFALHLLLGRKQLWLPKKLANYEFSQHHLVAVLKKAFPYLVRLERLFKPRMLFCTHPLAERCLGLILVILASILVLPIPFGNFLPAFSICILALGLIERDGLFIILGVIGGIVGTVIISGMIILVIKALILATQLLFSGA